MVGGVGPEAEANRRVGVGPEAEAKRRKFGSGLAHLDAIRDIGYVIIRKAEGMAAGVAMVVAAARMAARVVAAAGMAATVVAAAGAAASISARADTA